MPGRYGGKAVMARGNQQQPAFQDDRDRRGRLETLAEACQKTGWRVHACVLMATMTLCCSKHPKPTSTEA